MKSETAVLTKKLLDTHTAFQKERLLGSDLHEDIALHLDTTLKHAKKIKLNDVVSSDMVKATVHKYAIDMQPGPGIPEIVAHVARKLYNDPAHDQTLIKDIISDDAFSDILSKAADLDDLRNQVISEAIRNPVYVDLITEVLYHGIRDFIAQNPLAKKIPGAQSMMKLGKSVMDKASPNMEESVTKFIRKNIQSTLQQSEKFLQRNLSSENIKQVATDIWDKVKFENLGAARQFISEEDIEDIFVITYEYWRILRKTEYYRSMLDSGVDFFFDRYGKKTLSSMLEDIGITRDMMFDDAIHYAPYAIEALDKKGLLEEIIRNQLSPFYQSDQIITVLES